MREAKCIASGQVYRSRTLRGSGARRGGLEWESNRRVSCCGSYATWGWKGHTHGFRRTMPSCEKYPLPSSFASSRLLSAAELAGSAHGVASFCASIMSSMLASPHGASEQYMCSFRSSRRVKGWKPSCSWVSCGPRRRRRGDEGFGDSARSRHSWMR